MTALAAPMADTQTPTSLRVTVLAGGPSAEREVSLVSGNAIAKALQQRGHVVQVADISPDDWSALDLPADVVFPALHGTFGEDGQVQEALEARGLSYVGSNSQTSAITIDKVATKRAIGNLGVNLPSDHVVTATEVNSKAHVLTPPVVIKPVDQGSSIATHIVRDAAELVPSLKDVIQRYGRAMVERFVPGDEMTVSILDGDALPPICIRPKRTFYDYEAKYSDAGTEYLFDVGWSPDVIERAQRLSLAIYHELDCRHLARVDWIVTSGGELWFLEVNTMPGFTSHSLLPMAAAHVGIPFDALVDRLVRLAIGSRK